MARALIFVTYVGAGDASNMEINGEIRIEGAAEVVSWQSTPAWGSSPNDINAAIQDAAVAAATAAGHTVTSGTNDRITLAAAKAL